MMEWIVNQIESVKNMTIGQGALIVVGWCLCWLFLHRKLERELAAKDIELKRLSDVVAKMGGMIGVEDAVGQMIDRDSGGGIG